MHTALLHTDLGVARLYATDEALVRMDILDAAEENTEVTEDTPLLARAKDQLTRYFAGELQAFDLPLAPAGTEFQRRVWAELLKIPFGTTISYHELAMRLGDEKCIRAAASANGKNPIWLIIPCHRVIGADGKLVGYAGGLWRKKKMLQHEMQFIRPEGTLF
jgi:methylated-DNA-[protein]-cysteine S-methyltransferase